MPSEQQRDNNLLSMNLHIYFAHVPQPAECMKTSTSFLMTGCIDILHSHFQQPTKSVFPTHDSVHTCSPFVLTSCSHVVVHHPDSRCLASQSNVSPKYPSLDIRHRDSSLRHPHACSSPRRALARPRTHHQPHLPLPCYRQQPPRSQS